MIHGPAVLVLVRGLRPWPNIGPVLVWRLVFAGLCFHSPADTTHCPGAGLVLAHRLRRRARIGPALGQRVVFAGPVKTIETRGKNRWSKNKTDQ